MFEYPSIVFVATEVHKLPNISVYMDIADLLVKSLYDRCLAKA